MWTVFFVHSILIFNEKAKLIQYLYWIDIHVFGQFFRFHEQKILGGKYQILFLLLLLHCYILLRAKSVDSSHVCGQFPELRIYYMKHICGQFSCLWTVP